MRAILFILSSNRTKLVNFLKILVMIIMIVCLLGELSHILRPVNTDICINAIHTFHELPEESVEVIAFGSSHCWRGLNIVEMYKQYGIGAYNYGNNWQHINTTLLFVEDAFRTQKPKVILCDTYLLDILEDVGMNGEVYYTTELPWSALKVDYLEQIYGENAWARYVEYVVPALALHENWISLTRENFLENSNEVDFAATMGYCYTSQVEPVDDLKYNLSVQKELPEQTREILDDILQLCRENDAEIVFYTAPYVCSEERNNCYADAMKEYAENNSCVYLNLFEDVQGIGLDLGKDYYDPGHLNDNGAKKLAGYLGRYLVEHYELTDMRNEELNYLWER